MAFTGGSIPLVFFDDDKFDGNNLVAWSNLICIAAEVRGAMGYLKGKIQNSANAPSMTTSPVNVPAIIITSVAATTQTTATTGTPPTPPTPIAMQTSLPTSAPHIATSWELLNPTEAEWKAQNAWAKGLLIFNTKNPIGLGINIGGTAAEAWKLYIEVYEAGSDLAVSNTEMELQNMHYTDSDDFPNYISHIQVKWAQMNVLEASISNQAFKTILLNSLPYSWDPVVASLYCTSLSIETISQLNVHWLRMP